MLLLCEVCVLMRVRMVTPSHPLLISFAKISDRLHNPRQSKSMKSPRLLSTTTTTAAATTTRMTATNTRTTTTKTATLVWCLLLLMVLPTNAAARFSVLGPVLTVTLKDPEPSSFSSSEGSGGGEKWLNLNNLRPNLLWSIESRSKPLPNWLPSLTSLKANLGYQYDARFKNVPSYVEADAKFHEPKTNLDLQIQPSYDFRSRRASWLVQLLSNQKAYLMAKLGSGGSGGQPNKKQAKWLQLIRACYQLDLPYASVGAVRATPTWNLQTGEPSCVLEGMTGSQRTKAVLNLEYQNPTLTVVHSVSDR